MNLLNIQGVPPHELVLNSNDLAMLTMKLDFVTVLLTVRNALYWEFLRSSCHPGTTAQQTSAHGPCRE